MSDDIVSRLRGSLVSQKLQREAADEIERLRERLSRMEAK